jgi:3-dehydroquinate synthase
VITVAIRAGNYQYEALVGQKLTDTFGRNVAAKIGPSACAIISDSNVAPVFADRVDKSLLSAGFQPMLITIPAGEKSKTLEQAGAICDRMVATGLDRHSFVVGLGGGVVGDISGFVAAIYQRGIPHVQIPTTLLAMADSSIGGKNGVNTPVGKNLIGAFHQPSLVIDDIDVLKTLPPRELNQGFAEIIKHAIIADAEMFWELQDKVGQVSDLPSNPIASWKLAPPYLQQLIRRNIEIKSNIVAKDEFDRTGERALLNFGHTVGHAIERAGDYDEFLHGEAISLGIVAACVISRKKAGLPKDQQEAIVGHLRAFDLPTQLPSNFSRKKIFEALSFDKKFEGGKIRFVVTPAIGFAQIASDVTMDDIRDAVAEL